MKSTSLLSSLGMAIVFGAVLNSCSKDSPDPDPPVNTCANVNIVVTATPVSANACANDGSITVSATGSTNFSYKLNSTGTYQASASFTGLAAGSYTVFAKDGNGCEKTSAVDVASGGTAGPLFNAVKTLMNSRCVSCHNSDNANGGKNWTVDCNIVANSARINQRAVIDGTMPPTGPLSQSEKNIITAWINAGAAYTD